MVEEEVPISFDAGDSSVWCDASASASLLRAFIQILNKVSFESAFVPFKMRLAMIMAQYLINY